MPARLDKGSKSQHGFTLMEMVIGIVVFSIVLLLVVTLIAPQARRGIDPIWQVRAAELGQSLITEISAKAFDQHSDMAGGLLRCNEVTATPCTPAAFLGPEASESRANFDDVDDYHGLDKRDGDILNSLGNKTELYQGFKAAVQVFYDDNQDGIADPGIGNTKLIRVTITTPGNEAIVFTAYRSNY